MTISWHEDFGDEPAVEERMPFGVTPEEMRAALYEASLGTCEFCGQQACTDELIETGMHEYYTMDLDPGTLSCLECLESRRDALIPEDLSLSDCYTPVGGRW